MQEASSPTPVDPPPTKTAVGVPRSNTSLPFTTALVFAGALAAAAATAASGESVPRGPSPEIPLADLHLLQWTRKEGLPTDTLLDVHQGEGGYIWVSGFGGLARFDGVAFEVFNQNTDPELEASSFYKVLSHGSTLWIASQDAGIWQFENNRFSPLVDDQPLASVYGLLHDSSGTLWAGVASRGAMQLQGGQLVPPGHAALEGVTVRDILETGDGVLWFATEGRGLLRLEQGRLEAFTATSGLVHDSVTSLCPDTDSGLWIGTREGLSRFHDGVLQSIPELAGVEIFHVARDDHGSVWIAAEQGLFRRHAATGEVERLPQHSGRSMRSINGLAFDHEGSIWISSYANGLFQLRENSFINWNRSSGLATDRVNSVYERRDGSLLVGGDLGRIQVLENGNLSDFPLKGTLGEVRVRNFLEDGAGNLWISSYSGLLRIHGDEERLFTVDDGLPTNRARIVYEDRRNRLWVGTRGGGLVAITDTGGFEAIGTTDGLASDFVLSLAEGPHGDLLIGTQNGLSVLGEDGEITNYGLNDGLPGNLIFNIRPDEGGAAWLATTGGLARFVDGRIDSLTVSRGLPTKAIYDFAQDDQGGVWLTSSEGVIRVERRQLEDLLAGRRGAIEPRLFDEADGMTDEQCTGATSLAQTGDGALWVPTLGGLSRIVPQLIPGNPVAPPVLISRVIIDDESVDEAASGGSAESRPGAKTFEFRFAALTFQAPWRAEVKYKLEGFEDDWVQAGLRRRVVYTGLPPGDYSFRVVAANQDGVWNTEGASFDLRVQPRYFQTAWFLLLVALALVAGPLGIHRWRLRIVQHRSARLAQLLSEQRRLEQERTQLIGELELRNEQLENLTHAVSHDLKSPLFTIQGFVGALEKDIQAEDHGRVEKDLSRIREATTYMSRLLEQLSKVRRLERTEAKLERIDLGELAREVIAAVAGVIKDRKIRIEVDPRMPDVIGDRLQLTEMLQNLIDNAARFMGEQPGPRIDIGCRRDGDEPAFFVRDNGAGIEPRHQKRVFALFQRLDHRHDGTGVGLTIVKRVVEAHRGRVWVESDGKGKGTTFCFTLRTRRSDL